MQEVRGVNLYIICIFWGVNKVHTTRAAICSPALTSCFLHANPCLTPSTCCIPVDILLYSDESKEKILNNTILLGWSWLATEGLPSWPSFIMCWCACCMLKFSVIPIQIRDITVALSVHRALKNLRGLSPHGTCIEFNWKENISATVTITVDTYDEVLDSTLWQWTGGQLPWGTNNLIADFCISTVEDACCVSPHKCIYTSTIMCASVYANPYMCVCTYIQHDTSAQKCTCFKTWIESVSNSTVFHYSSATR